VADGLEWAWHDPEGGFEILSLVYRIDGESDCRTSCGLHLGLLIYMSIHDEILDRVGRKMLFPVLPQARGSTIRRALFVSERLHDALESPQGNQDWERRIAELRADLEVFVEARTIDPKYLFRLYPAGDGVWEIRSVRENPSIRVLGLFAWKDVFIATNHALREELGGWESRDWKTVKRAARAIWRQIFPAYDPKIVTSVKLVVTGALNGKYFKT
jgi:hypothetical protein